MQVLLADEGCVAYGMAYTIMNESVAKVCSLLCIATGGGAIFTMCCYEDVMTTHTKLPPGHTRFELVFLCMYSISAEQICTLIGEPIIVCSIALGIIEISEVVVVFCALIADLERSI